MEMPEVKSFNAELSGLYDNKPPISKAKMSAITKGAIKAIKFYKHVVHSVEKFIQKCKPEYKVPGLYVIDSIVRQSRHQFGQEKDVFAPRFAKNMQQTFANLFRCPPEDKRNIIRVLNLWQKNNVFTSQVIQPLLDMADPNHPLHQEIQQQQNNTANGSSLNLSHNTSDNKLSPGPSQHSPPMSSPMDGNQFQDEPSGPPNMKFNRKLLNDFEYESEDEPMMLDPPLPTSHSGHTSHSTHTSHSHSHTSHSNTQQQGSNPTDAMASILTNPEIMRQLQSLQAQMSLMTGMQIPSLMPMMSDIQLPQNQNQPGLPFLSNQDQQNDAKDEMANESDIEFVDAGPQVIEIPDANDSRSPSPKSRRRRSRSKSPRGRRGRRSRSRSPRRRRDTTRDRERERDREKERDRDKGKDYKEREADREKQKEREKKGLPPIKKENLSVCSTTLWVGHLSKLATPEELSDLFGAHGGVVSIDVVAPRGCAFVVMERRRDAYKALNKLNKHKLHSKEITVAWAPGKGVKGREWKEQWEAELGVSYLPWTSLHARWALGELQLDALEDGGMVDEETLPPWLPPRIMPKSMMENMSLLGMPPGMISLPPGLPPPMRPQMPPDMSGAALGSPANMGVPRMPPPGMGGVLPPGMPPGLPPGIRPPNMPPGLPGLGGDGGMPPGSMIRFPPGMPPQGMGQPGMVPGFLPGLLGVGGMGNMGMPNMAAMPNMPMFAPVIPQHAPPSIQMPQRPNEGNDDDAMDLDTEDMHQEEANGDNTDNLPPALLPDQIQALLSKPPPKFNASEPPPGFNASEPPPFPQQQQTTDDKQDDERKRSEGDRERDRRDRDRRGERRDRDNRRGNDRGNERGIDRGNERGIDRGNERGNDRGNERGNDRGIERGNDRGIERGNERGLERGNDRGIDRGNERGIDRGNERGIDRGNERGIDRGNERGIDRGNDRGNDRGIERGNERSSERGIDRGNERGIDRGNERGNERPNDRRDRGNERDRDGGRDDRRDRDRGRDRRDRDRDRGANRDNNGDRNREKSPRQPSVPETTEKSLQERLWEMANGKPPPTLRQDDKPRDEYPEGRDDREAERMRPADNERSSGGGGGGGGAPGEGGEAWGPHSRPPPHLAPPFRPGGPWMDGPPGPPGPFGPRFNGMGPPFNRPPFERPPFDGRPPFDRPPFRMPFDMGMNRPPFDGPRAHFDGPRPPFEGMRPPFAGPRPAYDGPRPAYDGPRPAYDGPRPAYDGPRAAYDGPPPADGFDRGNRRFEEREQFPPAPAPPGGGAAWGGERREWDERRRPRDERARDTRRPPRDQRDQRDQRAPHRDNRAPGNEERAPRRDDRHREEPPPEDWSDVDRVAPVLSAPRDERPAPDKPAPRDERKDAAREERRRERQDRKSRWGGDAEDEPHPEPDVPVVVPDEIILKLQETIARFPQSESESESLNAKKESEPLPPTEPTPAGDGEGAAPSHEPMDLPLEDKVSPPKDDFQATELSKEGNCLENVEPELPQEKDFEPEKFPPSEREDLELPPMDSSPNNTQQSFESESTKHSFEMTTSQQNVEAESAFVAMETEPEKLVADLYDDSATDVGIDTSFANPLPEEMIAKLDPPTLTLSTDDIFEKEATSDNDNTSDSKGA